MSSVGNHEFDEGVPVLPPTTVKRVAGIKVGFIGMTLESTPTLVAQAGIRDVQFGDSALRARAVESGLSLSDYLLAEVTRIARRPTLDELLVRARALPPVEISESSADIVRRSR